MGFAAITLFSFGLIEYHNRYLYAFQLENAHVRLGKQLARTSPGLVAVHDAGAVPYFSGWRSIDTFGLNDPVIAMSSSYDPAYVLEQLPDVLVIPSTDKLRLKAPLPYLDSLYNTAVSNGMKVISTYEFSTKYYLHVLVWPGSDVERFLMNERIPLSGHKK